MIQRAFITEWRSKAPWALDEQVEQDLVVSRALVELYSEEVLRRGLAFRGGTALHKLYLEVPARYSEDIDLVQVEAGPIGPVVDAIRRRLDPWLGVPQWKRGHGRVTLNYRFMTEPEPVQQKRLKVEINTREHFSVLGLVVRRFDLASRWWSRQAEITTYALDELLGTKLRALYQRKKCRDLFDLWIAASWSDVDASKVVHCFLRYVGNDGLRVSRAEFEANLHRKLSDPLFGRDVEPLISLTTKWDQASAAEYVLTHLAPLLPGQPWKANPKPPSVVGRNHEHMSS
ncbi:nucleotidyl transferase AbiEii/AbiGii toxin family protein [Candidatus Fermentibacteria bacterium]|nr:nucleotidyl transferase AbiEii/AbiGii toxin family protein [Candidatus Fermentibacteria bacterium]